VGREVTLNLVGVKEIAQRAGVTVDAVHKWRERDPSTFPRPVAELAQGPVWKWEHVDAWLKARGGVRRQAGKSVTPPQ
jgi:predicted DNA-binding transcriptional regulator AlpA